MIKKVREYRIAKIFGFDLLDRDEQLRRVILVRVILLTVLFGLIWSVLYFFLDQVAGGTVVFVYSILSLVNLLTFYISRNYPPFRFIQLILILLLPVGTQIALGGFYSASGVVLASLLCPLGALMFYNMRVARVLFFLFLGMVALVALTEFIFPDREAVIDKNVVLLFYAMNTIVISSIVFALLLYFVAQRALFQKMLAEKNKDLTDSIRYAKRIQDAILPSVKNLKAALPDSFILYKPKDIVAGDFYFFERKDNLVFFAAADCTGHGVPGAMVSVVCANALLRVIKEFNETDPGKILDAVRDLVIENFARGEGHDPSTLMYVRDGMDISFCTLNLDTNELWWAGANNGLWLVREVTKGGFIVNGALIEPKGPDGKRAAEKEQKKMAELQLDEPAQQQPHYFLHEIRPNKQPVGKSEHMFPFTSYRIQLQKGDNLYLLTDGYEDQFGGQKGKKFKAANIKMMLEAICHKPMDQQQLRMDEVFETWRGELEQVDDVCVIGVRL